MTAKRRFEHVTATSSKFWEVWRDGSMVYVQFGKLGSDGQLKVKAEKTAEAAERSVEKQVREKLAKGYAEAASAPPAPAAPRLAPKELERHLASLPPLGDDDDAYLVFADWLQAQGHPWGELITMQHGAQTAPSAKKRDQLARAADKLIAQHRTTLLGPAAEHEHSSFAWHLGFLRTATLGTAADPASMTDALDALLARPVASRLEGLVLNPIPAQFETHRDWDSSPDNVVDPWTELDELARRVPARVTHLGFGGWPAPAASAYVQMPSYTALSKPWKRLRRLELTGWPHPRPGKLALPELTDLEVRFGMASGKDLSALTAGKLGKLERISVWLGGRAYCILDDVYPPDEDSDRDERYPSHFDGSDLELLGVHGVNTGVRGPEIASFIDALPRTIKHLGLQSATLDDEMCRAILARKRIGALETLDLSGGTLDDDTAKLLLTTSAKKSLSRLKTLDLERNCLGAATAKKLAAAFPAARLRNQRKTARPELFLRYVAVME